MKNSIVARTSLVVGCLFLSTSALLIHPDVRNFVDYRVSGENIGAPSETGVLPSIPHTTGPPVRLAVVGDVGTGEEAEQRTADAVDLAEAESEFAALLMLGDNVYPNGDPAQLERTVFEPFSGVLDGETRLLAVLGNHDVWDDNGDAHSEAIGMPDRWYRTEIGDVLIVALDSTRPDDVEQLKWLETTLAENDKPWVIAMLHHPPYSGGYHGSSIDVRDAFSPLFERYGVQLVLTGHDHDYQRSEAINGVTYVVSGGAAKLRPANRASFTEVAWSTLHFVDIVVWPDRIDVRAVNQAGEMFDSTTIVGLAG